MIEQNENRSKWGQDSILVKLGIITVIILTLLFPSSWIQGLIEEREGNQKVVVDGIADNWSGSQLVQGPVLALPYKKKVTEMGADHKAVNKVLLETLFVLPEKLQIGADVKTQLYQSGVYDAVVYNSKIQIRGSFNKPDLTNLGIDQSDIEFEKARLIFSISDLKGLKNNPVLVIKNQEYVAEPTTNEPIPFEKGLQVGFQLQKDQGFDFNYNLELKGSKDLNFLPLGKTTNVNVKSDWKNPGFNGRYLPDSQTHEEKGFGAKWHMLYYNRPFPGQWLNDDSALTVKKAKADAVFGVKLQLPIDQYRKIMRTTKYSTLIIVLTFVSLFLTELIRKQRIHLFNYTLIGAAMVVYYTLLLSFAEQIGYNYAYLISSVSTITLIALFTASLLKNRNAALSFSLILSIFYGFIYIIIQLEELSLLVGSIALFIVVAMLMYFSRKINWDKH